MEFCEQIEAKYQQRQQENAHDLASGIGDLLRVGIIILVVLKNQVI